MIARGAGSQLGVPENAVRHTPAGAGIATVRDADPAEGEVPLTTDDACEPPNGIVDGDRPGVDGALVEAADRFGDPDFTGTTTQSSI